MLALINGIIVWRAATTQNGLTSNRVVNARLNQLSIDMDGHHFPQYQPSINGQPQSRFELHDVRHSTFEGHGAFLHSGWLYEPRRRMSETCQVELINLWANGGTSGIHCLSQRPSGQVPGKLACRRYVADAVFPANAGKTNNRGLVIERVEEAVRRKVDDAFFADRGDPADGARTDNGVKRIVIQAVT